MTVTKGSKVQKLKGSKGVCVGTGLVPVRIPFENLTKDQE
jgi:hypothetical protein